MKTSPAGLDLIKRHEKCRLQAYLPTKHDVRTIGWGHTGPSVVEGQVVTQTQADDLLAMDLARFERCVGATCPEATQGQFDAMVSLCFNIGDGAFPRSSVARLHNAKRYAEAGQAFALWNEQKGIVLQELVHRRAEEAAMYAADCPPPAAELAVDIAPGATGGEKPLTESRTLNSQAIAGAATVGGGAISAVEQNKDTLQQVQDALGGIAPYFQWAAVAVAVIGLIAIAYGAYVRWEMRHSGRA